MSDPFVIVIGGQIFRGWTSARLKRSRKDLTGSLTVDVFFTFMPKNPVMRGVSSGKEIQVYVGGHLAFNGVIDKRGAGGKKGEGGASVSSTISSDAYRVTITARGKTKYLVQSSHDHPTGQMKNASVAEAVRELTKNFGIRIDDQSGDSDKIERVTFRDGAPVFSEIHRWTRENNILAYEGRDGTLKLEKAGNGREGEPLILGDNILEFSSEQSEDEQNNKITVKGQRTDPKVMGKAAIKRKIEITDSSMKGYSPLVIQITGDATDIRLRKRAKLESDRRQQDSKEVSVEVFHVQSRTGQPWDLGLRHYVEIPPENIFDVFEVTDLEYEVDAKDKLKTKLTLSPVPSSEGGTKAVSDAQAYGNARRAQIGVGYEPGLYPSPWSIGPVQFAINAAVDFAASFQPPPLTLPRTSDDNV